MAELEVKEKPTRYPMKTHEQSRKTLHRLTLDLLHKKLDIQTYRAAVYGLSVQCSLFKYSTAEKSQQDVQFKVSPEEYEVLATQEEREKYFDELCEKHLARKAANQKAYEEVELFNKQFLENKKLEKQPAIPEKIETSNEIILLEKPCLASSTKTPKTGQWKQRGIGAKRG